MPIHPRKALIALGVAITVLTAIFVTSDRAAGEQTDAATQTDPGAEADYGVEALDPTATTDDHSVTIPTAWWVYTNVTADFVTARINALGARLTDIEIHSLTNAGPRFTVRLVRNSGAYAVPAWWWYYGLTFAQVGRFLGANNARLLDLEPYDIGGGTIRYAVVMVANIGPTARAWSYLSGVTASQIASHIGSTGHRLIDLDHYFVGTHKRYSAVFVANTGSDAKAWQWWLNQRVAGVTARLNDFSGRLVKLDRQADGTFNVIMVRNTGADAAAWWWGPAFGSVTALLDYANQLAVRPTDIETYIAGGQRRYAAVFIDNANAATRRIRGLFAQKFLDENGNPTRGIFEAYLKRVGSSVLVNLNATRQAEVASSLKALHLVHAMRSVQDGESLSSSFVYYDYPNSPFNAGTKDACPIASDEISANEQDDYHLEKGLDEMMRISDNRTTRGVVLRYGRAAINATAAVLGLSRTILRNDIGCAYYDPVAGAYGAPGNDTTAADLARLYELVWNSMAVTGTARNEFLESANPAVGASAALQQIIDAEAAALGKSAIAAEFGSLVRMWSKGGSYGTCLGNPGCEQRVTIRSGAGIIRLPVKSGTRTAYRTFVFARLISDVPVSCWGCAEETSYTNVYSKVANELHREQIRAALLTW
jgi:beta-lactamase class A